MQVGTPSEITEIEDSGIINVHRSQCDTWRAIIQAIMEGGSRENTSAKSLCELDRAERAQETR